MTGRLANITSPQNKDLINTRLGAKKMTEERFEALDQQWWDALERLFHAWINTTGDDAGEEENEELDKAADAFTLAHEAMKSVRGYQCYQTLHKTQI
jgi:hypothetical protein